MAPITLLPIRDYPLQPLTPSLPLVGPERVRLHLSPPNSPVLLSPRLHPPPESLEAPTRVASSPGYQKGHHAHPEAPQRHRRSSPACSWEGGAKTDGAAGVRDPFSAVDTFDDPAKAVGCCATVVQTGRRKDPLKALFADERQAVKSLIPKIHILKRGVDTTIS